MRGFDQLDHPSLADRSEVVNIDADIQALHVTANRPILVHVSAERPVSIHHFLRHRTVLQVQRHDLAVQSHARREDLAFACTREAGLEIVRRLVPIVGVDGLGLGDRE